MRTRLCFRICTILQDSTKIFKILFFAFIILSWNNGYSQDYLYTVMIGDTVKISTSTFQYDSIQWQQSTDSLTWSNIANAISNPLTVVTTYSPTGRRFFRAKVSINNLCSFYSFLNRQKIANNINEIQVGDRFHGGIVFHNDSSGNVLIAPRQDQSGSIQWGCSNQFILNSSSLTNGALNTIAIVDSCNQNYFAAKACSQYILESYDDWYLPSKNELNYLYIQHQTVYGFAYDYYWSSSQANNIEVWVQNYQSGAQLTMLKGIYASLRCIRSYSPSDSLRKLDCTIDIPTTNAYNGQQICFVTVDSSSNKNNVVWENTPDVGIADINVYKENGLNEYTQIGTVTFSNSSNFIDNSSNPSSHGDKYKISIIDTCGRESNKSYFHKTINLTVAVNIYATALNWDDYVDESGDFVPNKFYIYRGLIQNNLQLYDSISASFHSYNDIGVPAKYYYMVGVKRTNGCNISKSISNNIFSNTVKNFIDGIEYNIFQNEIKIYPNPFDESTTVYIDEPLTQQFSIIISDLTGKNVHVYKNISEREFVIQKGNLQSGIYFVKLICDKIKIGKLVVQ